MKNLSILPIFLLIFFVFPVRAQSLKLYLAGSGADPDLSETQPTGSPIQSTVWNGTYIKIFDNYYLTENINGNDYTFNLLCASTATRDFTAVIKIDSQQVANTSFTVSGTTYTLYSIPVTGVDTAISTGSEVTLEVTIDGSGGATSGILWGNTGAPFAHILISPASPPVELLGPQFKAFVNRVDSVPDPEKQAIIDSFMNAAPSFPFIEEDTIVYYIYQGGVGSVTVPGDANNWDISAFPMTQLDGTIFWYREAVFESDARLDYKFGLNGNDWILDPLNPNQVSGEFGPNSELAMPDYVQPLEIEYYANIPHGTLTSFPFTSDTLGNTRTIRVYTPPEYDSHPTYSYPVMLFHDGEEYLSLGSAVNILDYLLSENKMNPIIAVFVPPIDRDNEYAFNLTQQFESFIVDELMPHIDATYRTHTTPDKRAMVGARFGGLITTQICYNRPESFGLSAPYSPSYWVKNMEVFNAVLNGPQKDIDWYLDWGTYEYEPSVTVNARSMRDGLISKNYDIMWKEWYEGSSWGSWRAHLDIALGYFFQKTLDVSDEKSIPEEYFLSQNFPNPFNPCTKIRYSVPQSSNVVIKVFDILGNEIETLVNLEKQAGTYEVEFNGHFSEVRNLSAGRQGLSSGVYFYQLRATPSGGQAGDFVQTKKMLLLK